MGIIVTSPGGLRTHDEISIFLGGGISNCPDWQEGVAVRLAAETDAVIYNPRRLDFDMSAYEEVSTQQIRWEHLALRMSTVNLFWFPEETLCPITLMEYGSAMERMNMGAIMVGAHPNYQRLFDIKLQTELTNGGHIFNSLDSLVDQTVILLNNLSQLKARA